MRFKLFYNVIYKRNENEHNIKITNVPKKKFNRI